MAKTLMESIRNKLSNPTVQAAPLDQTQAIQQLQSAKTGKAAGASGPRVSSLAERLAGQQGQAQLGQIQQQGTLLGQQQQGQQQEQSQAFNQQQTALSAQQDMVTQQYANQATSIMDKLEAEGKKLDFDKDKSQLEQLSFYAAMSDKNYIHQLQQSGAQNRLTNELSFKEAMQKDIFRDMEEALRGNINFNEMMALDDREFKQMMAKIDIKTAAALATTQIEAANRQQIATGVKDVAKAGLEYGYDQSKKDNK